MRKSKATCSKCEKQVFFRHRRPEKHYCGLKRCTTCKQWIRINDIQSTFVLFPKSERLPVENVQMSVKAKTIKVKNMKKKKKKIAVNSEEAEKEDKESYILF